MHGANRLGGNSLSDLVVFGRRAGIGAAEYIEAGDGRAALDDAEVEGAVDEALAPFDRASGENPYDIQRDLQEMMQANVGIIRTASRDRSRHRASSRSSPSACKNITVKGGRAYNPGWNLATDLPSMISVSRAPRSGARERKESRGGHTREDFPAGRPRVRRSSTSPSRSTAGAGTARSSPSESPILVMPDELKALLEEAK